jgi:proteasome lid subunit RPN8/RPN11
MTPQLLEAILAHARAEAPRECCGMLVHEGHQAVYHPCRNLGEGDTIDIHPEDQVAAEDAGILLGIVHSHAIGTTAPGPLDQPGCDRSGLPWWIVTLDGQWNRITPKNWEPTGHAFVWGVQDCYTLVSDWFGGLPGFLREPDFWRHSDLFGEGLASAGFHVVEGDPRPGDGLLFRVHGGHPDHCAVYAGEGRIIHQPTGRVGLEELMGRLVEKLAFVVRRA